MPRPHSIEGKTVALLDISKPRGDIFLDRLAEHLSEFGVESRRYRKPTFARVAPADLKQAIVSECVISLLKPSPIEAHVRRAVCTTSLSSNPAGFQACSSPQANLLKRRAAQGRALGFHPPVCYVPHPIQDRSDHEIRELAGAAFEEILAQIVASPREVIST